VVVGGGVWAHTVGGESKLKRSGWVWGQVGALVDRVHL
jgi:hypothetical protein